jgi:hypothetical protein
LAGLAGDGIGPYNPDNLPKPIPRPEPDPEPGPAPVVNKADYTIVVWTARWCSPCRQWKKYELPSLLEAGYKVTEYDFDRDNPPENIESVPTVLLYYKGKLIRMQGYWTAEDIIAYIDNHLSLKR